MFLAFNYSTNIIFVDGKPKLADIGLVTGIGTAQTFVGTEGYYAPEGPGEPAADLFSFGKVLYQISTGLNPIRFPDLPTAYDEAADGDRFRGLNDIVLKACEKDQRKRYHSAQEMQAALLALQTEIEKKQVPPK